MSLFVDLTLPPYLVVPDDPTRASSNAAAINAAFADHAGRGALLLLPPGDIFVDRAGPTWSIRPPSGVSRTSLRGAGMFATTLVQEGSGDPETEWDLLLLDSCSDVTVSQLGFRQGRIEHPNALDDRNALINVVARSGASRNLVFEHVAFGPAIGDAFRVAGAGLRACCEQVRLSHFVIDTGKHPQGAGGLGRGSRSGVSLRGGIRKLEIGHGNITGARLCPVELESDGPGPFEDILVHHLVIDNDGGHSSTAIHLVGALAAPLERITMSDLIVLEGNVRAVLTRDATLSNVTIRTSEKAPQDLDGKALLDWSQAHENTSVTNLSLHRGTGSPSGPLVTVIPGGRAGGTINVVAGIGLVDGETITVCDGVVTSTFELDSDGEVEDGHIPVPFSSRSSAIDVRDAIISAVNADIDLRVNASASALPAQSHVVVLANDHYGAHGNVALASSVAHPGFVVAGMIGGVGESVNLRFAGGTWRSYVPPGIGKRYFEARGSRRLSVTGVDMQLAAVSPNEYGFGFRSLGDVVAPSLSNVRIESISRSFGVHGSKLIAAAYFAATNGGSITDIGVVDVRAPDACTTGVLLDRNTGAMIDSSPIIQGCDFAGASNAWLAINDAVDEVSPIVAGNRGGRTWQVGTAEPGTLASAVQGSRYTRQSGDATTEWLKQSGTGATGWVLIAGGVERRYSDGEVAIDKQVTFISGHRVTMTLPNHFTDGYIKHFVVVSGAGDLAPTNFVEGTEHLVTWQGPCAFSLVWDASVCAWRVLNLARGALVI